MVDGFTAKEHLIDCGVAPFVPDNWTIAPESDQLPNRVKDVFRWDGKVGLYLSEQQRQGGYHDSCKLKKELGDKPVLPANVLDYLLAYPYLIPEEWKSKTVFFWGTAYDAYNNDFGLRVRCLFWDGARWDWGADWPRNGCRGPWLCAFDCHRQSS